MEIEFVIADKSPLLYEDADVERKRVRITKISSTATEYCAMRYLTILLQSKYRQGWGEYGKLNVAGEIVGYEEF